MKNDKDIIGVPLSPAAWYAGFNTHCAVVVVDIHLYFTSDALLTVTFLIVAYSLDRTSVRRNDEK